MCALPMLEMPNLKNVERGLSHVIKVLRVWEPKTVIAARARIAALELTILNRA